MTFNVNFLPLLRSHGVVKSVWEMSSRCWPGSVTDGVFSASKGWLRRFLLLKLLTVLLFPHGAGLPLLVGCIFSLWALLVLHSPHISTKPSTVLLSQLALTDSLVLLQWVLRMGSALGKWMEEAGCEAEMSLMKEGPSICWREATNVLCQQLLDAHHLASLLLLGLLGLEATLVSHWPLQTRRFRTSHCAHLSSILVWIVVLLELVFLWHSKFLQDFSPQFYPSTLQDSPSYLGLVPGPSLPAFSICLRKMLWLMNSWLHYAIFNSKPQRSKSTFH